MSRRDPSLLAHAGYFLTVVLPAACGGDAPPPAPAAKPPRSAAPADFEPQRPEFEELAQALFASSNELVSRTLSRRMNGALENPELVGKDRFRMLDALALRLLREGEPGFAATLYEGQIADPETPGPRALRLERALGLARLRAADEGIRLEGVGAEGYTFPGPTSGIEVDEEAARAALASLLRFLEDKPGHLPTRWLANLAALWLGEHPRALPAEHVVPLEAFESTGPTGSTSELGRFADVAPRHGMDLASLGGGALVEDFDGDGRLDVLASTFEPLGALAFFRNSASGFEDRSIESGADDQLGGMNLVAGDYDGDGDADVLLLRGAWLGREGRLRNSLLRNDGGAFVDVTREAGLAEPAYPTQTAAWGDFDGDGDLDLFVGNESAGSADPEQDNPSQLFRNEGDGTFTDVAASAGVTNDRYCKGVTAGDFDDDGDLDLYVSNFGPNRLYRNEGGLAFRDVAEELGVAEPRGPSSATWFFDYDDDGRLDLFVAACEGGPADLVAKALGMGREHARARLYKNLGGTFEEVGARVGLDGFYLPLGAGFGDLDGDGWLDLFLTRGDASLESSMPNVVLRNVDGERFEDVTRALGFGQLHKGHGVAFADLDGDGDQDLYHQRGGLYSGDRYRNALFENPGNGNRFLYVDLVGRSSTIIGARLVVEVTGPTGTRRLHRAVGSVSSFGGSPLRQELGLGDATRIDRVEVAWPATGVRQAFEGVPFDAWIRITEGEESFQRLELERTEL